MSDPVYIPASAIPALTAAFQIALEGETDTRRDPDRGGRLDALLDGLPYEVLEEAYLAAHRLAESIACAQIRKGPQRQVIGHRLWSQFGSLIGCECGDQFEGDTVADAKRALNDHIARATLAGAPPP